MKNEVYVCWKEGDAGKIDGYKLIMMGSGADILNPDNLIASFPVYPSPAGTPLIPASMLHKMAELQNQGYKIRFFF